MDYDENASDSPERPASRLMESLGQLQDEVTILRKTTAELAKLLEPVTRPTRNITIEGVRGDGIPAEGHAHSPLLTRLQTTCNDLAAATKELRRLSERLDL